MKNSNHIKASQDTLNLDDIISDLNESASQQLPTLKPSY